MADHHGDGRVFPRQHWTKLHGTTLIERLNKEVSAVLTSWALVGKSVHWKDF